MNDIQMMEKAKIIGIGEEGIKNLDSIQNKIENNMEIEKISINQDVDKDYVRELLDGVNILFLTYNSEDKKSLQIVNAIGYMAEERRVLSIGLDFSQKENKDEVNLNKEFKVSDENKEILLNIINMLLDSISYDCMINIDLSDLKELLCTDKSLKYSQGEFKKNESYGAIVKKLIENTITTAEEGSDKKQIILVEMDSNYCENEMDIMNNVNDLLMEIKKSNNKNYESIFSLYIREKQEGKIKIGLVYN